jgi:hypothetical protein
MRACCSGFCSSVDHHFDAAVAAGDLKRYKAKGPNPTTRQLRDGVLVAGAADSRSTSLAWAVDVYARSAM